MALPIAQIGIEAATGILGSLAGGISQIFAGPDENAERQRIAQEMITEYSNAGTKSAKLAVYQRWEKDMANIPYESRTKVQRRYWDAWHSVKSSIEADLQQQSGATLPMANNLFNSSSSNQSNKMLDILKRWAVVIIAAVAGLASILYYSRTKNTTDKKKRKPFLFLGIAAAAVGAFLGYKKVKG